MTLIAELKEVSKAFGNNVVVDSVSLQIHEGEILALLGPNGSGKSTILKIFAFIEDPTSGEVDFLGKKVNFNHTEKVRLQSTLVFQKTSVFSTSVYNNVAYGLKIRKFPKAERDVEVRNALKLVKLEGFEKRNARKLSGGEQQRVAIARALVLKTKLLLLDEPTANLDPKNARILEDVIETVNRESKVTIVMATHNMFQAKTLPHRIALMNEGKITEVGSPSVIFSQLSKNLVSFASVGNTFKGVGRVISDGLSVVDLSGLEIEVVGQKVGEVSVYVNPRDIILCKTLLESSARNVFRGRIVEISDLGDTVKLTVDTGKEFSVLITQRSFKDMRLSLSEEVYIGFKASSVQVL